MKECKFYDFVNQYLKNDDERENFIEMANDSLFVVNWELKNEGVEPLTLQNFYVSEMNVLGLYSEEIYVVKLNGSEGMVLCIVQVNIFNRKIKKII